MIKAIFFDVDGTLYSHTSHTIPNSTLIALKKLREKGIKLYIATGRHMRELHYLKVPETFSFDGYITLNGQYCLDHDELIYHRPIDPMDIQRYLDYIEKEPISTLFIEKDEMYVNFINEHTKAAQAAISSPIEPVRTNIDGQNPIYQMCPYVSLTTHQAIFTSLLPHCSITSWHPQALDITPLNGTKVTGIMKIMEKYGYQKQEVMSFGDGHNDLEMMEHTGISIAMGNANEEVKKRADYITTSIDDDGIYQALIHYDLIKNDE